MRAQKHNNSVSPEGQTARKMAANIQIEPLKPEQVPEAARALARAFVTNPLHRAAFGPGRLDKNEAFFRGALTMMRGPKLVATDSSRILGVIHWVDAPLCQFSGLDKLRITPALVRGLGPRSALRVSSWLSAWSKHDPSAPHLHLGPIGVAPEAQGRHIGHRLMERYCETFDRTGGCGYLETDRPENVGFYRRFGFEITEEISVLGVTNYFMWREAKGVTLQSPL